MVSGRTIGTVLFSTGIFGIIPYSLLMIYSWEVTVRITLFAFVATILGILAWLGYTMVSSSSENKKEME